MAASKDCDAPAPEVTQSPMLFRHWQRHFDAIGRQPAQSLGGEDGYLVKFHRDMEKPVLNVALLRKLLG